MNVLKSVCALLLSLVLLLALAACSQGDPSTSSSTSSSSSSSSSSTSVSSSSESSSSESSEASGADDAVTGVTYQVPEDWTQQSMDGVIVYYSPDYPNDTSNINLYTSAKDPNFSKATKEQFEAVLKATFANLEGAEDMDMSINAFEFVEVDAMQAIRVDASYTLNGIEIRQTQYMVDGDKNYAFTFTEVGDADWSEVFAQCIESIKAERAAV